MKLKALYVLPALAALVAGIGLVSIEVSNLIDMQSYEKVDILEVNDVSLMVGAQCTAITAETSEERADSIKLGMEKTIDERPNTHDLFVDAFRLFNVTVDSVTIDLYDGRYFYSKLVLKSQDKVLKIDSRPSDAIAIALRADAPIYINKTLLYEQGEKVC